MVKKVEKSDYCVGDGEIQVHRIPNAGTPFHLHQIYTNRRKTLSFTSMKHRERGFLLLFLVPNK